MTTGTPSPSPPQSGTAHLLVHCARMRAQAQVSATGVFQLAIAAQERQGQHQVEPWRLLWAGPEAQAFWQAHGPALQPGTPLAVQVHRMRAHVTGRAGAEIVAHVLQCALAPTRWGAAPVATQPAQEQAA